MGVFALTESASTATGDIRTIVTVRLHSVRASPAA
eukprot:COSAG06_NODE_35405_length_460_cov_1.132964_1_plen_34_part_10